MPLITGKQGWPQQPSGPVSVDPEANCAGIFLPGLSLKNFAGPEILSVYGSAPTADPNVITNAGIEATLHPGSSSAYPGLVIPPSFLPDTQPDITIIWTGHPINISSENGFVFSRGGANWSIFALFKSSTQLEFGIVTEVPYLAGYSTTITDSFLSTNFEKIAWRLSGTTLTGFHHRSRKTVSLTSGTRLRSGSGLQFSGATTSQSGGHNTAERMLVFKRPLSDSEVWAYLDNPNKVFKKQDKRILIPSAGGGGLSLTGSLTGQGSTLSATATNTEVHAISGALVGAGATLSGTATRIYSLTGSLTGQGATLSGSATTLESHAATGALVGSGSTLAATATNTEIHAATGSLIGSGSTLSGATTNTPLGINASGSLVGQGATLSATATNTEVHTCTGALYGQGATLSGALTRVFSASGSLVGAGSTLSATASNAVALFLATGALVGQGSTLTGSATNTETHAVSGSLAGQGSTLSATAALANLHTLSGSLVGSGSSLVGYASGPTTAFEASPDAIVTVINKRNRVSVISRRS